MRFLSRIEEILLLAIWKLGETAYGISIMDLIERETDSPWPSGAVYGALGRLQNNGYIVARKGESRPERGGRHRIYYSLSAEGTDKLADIQRMQESLWAGMPKLSDEG